MSSRRMAVALLGAAVLTGVVLGLVLGRAGPDSAAAQGPAEALSRGPFKTISWGTTGTATIERTASGRLVLRLSRDFRTQRAPELFIHMGGTRMPLKRASGAQSYALSEHVDPNARVQVFCEKCNRAWGEAKLAPVPHRVD